MSATWYHLDFVFYPEKETSLYCNPCEIIEETEGWNIDRKTLPFLSIATQSSRSIHRERGTYLLQRDVIILLGHVCACMRTWSHAGGQPRNRKRVAEGSFTKSKETTARRLNGLSCVKKSCRPRNIDIRKITLLSQHTENILLLSAISHLKTIQNQYLFY